MIFSRKCLYENFKLKKYIKRVYLLILNKMEKFIESSKFIFPSYMEDVLQHPDYFKHNERKYVCMKLKRWIDDPKKVLFIHSSERKTGKTTLARSLLTDQSKIAYCLGGIDFGRITDPSIELIILDEPNQALTNSPLFRQFVSGEEFSFKGNDGTDCLYIRNTPLVILSNDNSLWMHLSLTKELNDYCDFIITNQYLGEPRGDSPKVNEVVESTPKEEIKQNEQSKEQSFKKNSGMNIIIG